MPAPSGGKQPIHVGMKDERPFAFAGLTERWLSPGGEVLDSCTIVTTSANALLATMHDRMPVIVGPADYARWLHVASDRRDRPAGPTRRCRDLVPRVARQQRITTTRRW
jgi:putative SOS response-associated peptidase YedK